MGGRIARRRAQVGPSAERFGLQPLIDLGDAKAQRPTDLQVWDLAATGE
jgi:hypothetical protein